MKKIKKALLYFVLFSVNPLLSEDLSLSVSNIVETTTEDCFHLGVKALLTTGNGKILLLQKRHPVKPPYWDIPGGRIQKKETITETLAREVEEETGFQMTENPIFLGMFLSKVRIPIDCGDVGLILSVYRYDLQDSFIPRLSSEHDDFAWFSLSEAAEELKKHYPVDCIEKIFSAM